MRPGVTFAGWRPWPGHAEQASVLEQPQELVPWALRCRPQGRAQWSFGTCSQLSSLALQNTVTELHFGFFSVHEENINVSRMAIQA